MPGTRPRSDTLPIPLPPPPTAESGEELDFGGETQPAVLTVEPAGTDSGPRIPRAERVTLPLPLPKPPAER